MQLQRIQTLYLKDDVIIGEIQPRERCGRGKFEIDAPEDGDKSTKDLVGIYFYFFGAFIIFLYYYYYYYFIFLSSLCVPASSCRHLNHATFI